MTRQPDHQHPHDDATGATHRHESYATRSHPESVVLEIGGDLGALVIYTTSALHGMEIEISPASSDHQRSHKEVLHRPTPSRNVFAAVFDRLPAGSYSLWVDNAARERGVLVEAGRVAELDWRPTRTAPIITTAAH